MITVRNLQKIYGNSETQTYALKGVSFDIARGEFVAIMGASGSGKSTLLHQLGILDVPTAGSYSIEGTNILTLSNYQKSLFRLHQLGYVFQEFALLDELTVLENVSLPLSMMGIPRSRALVEAAELLDRVGLGDKLRELPSHLSGGQQQRVAIARALVGRPQIIFADEPCANLDTENSKQVLELFKTLNRELKQTIIMVTHEPWHVTYVSRVIELRDGLIVRDRAHKNK